MEEDRDEKLAVGDLVFIQATGWEGRKGVVEETLEDGKLLVSVFPKRQKKQVSLKPSSLEKFSEIDPSGGPWSPRKDRMRCCCNCRIFVNNENVKDCSLCLLVGYCSDKCQQANWREEHKQECETLRRAKKLVKRQGVLPLTADQDTVEWICMVEKIAIRLIDKGHYDAAEALLCDGIQNTRKEMCGPFYRLLSGVVGLQGRHRFDEAVDLMERAIRLHQDGTMPPEELARLYQNLAGMFDQQGDCEQAITASQQAIKLDPSYVKMHYNIGFLQFRLNNHNEAEASYRKFLKAAGPFHDPNQELARQAAVAASYLAIVMGLQIEEKVQASRALGVLDIIQEEVQEESKEAVDLFNLAIRLGGPKKDLLKKELKRHLAFMEEHFAASSNL